MPCSSDVVPVISHRGKGQGRHIMDCAQHGVGSLPEPAACSPRRQQRWHVFAMCKVRKHNVQHVLWQHGGSRAGRHGDTAVVRALHHGFTTLELFCAVKSGCFLKCRFVSVGDLRSCNPHHMGWDLGWGLAPSGTVQCCTCSSLSFACAIACDHELNHMSRANNVNPTVCSRRRDPRAAKEGRCTKQPRAAWLLMCRMHHHNVFHPWM